MLRLFDNAIYRKLKTRAEQFEIIHKQFDVGCVINHRGQWSANKTTLMNLVILISNEVKIVDGEAKAER
jgi:hypothetical protein